MSEQSKSEQRNHIITYTHFDNRLGRKDGTQQIGPISKRYWKITEKKAATQTRVN